VSSVEIKAGANVNLGGVSTTTKSVAIEQPAVNVSISRVGTSDAHFVFAQEQSAEEWVIEHNMNKNPSVTIVDSGENVIFAEIEYLDLNNLIIRFNGGNSGKAYLN
jgi:hypothetical protein